MKLETGKLNQAAVKQGVSVHFLSSFDCVRLIYLLDSLHGAKYSIGI